MKYKIATVFLLLLGFRLAAQYQDTTLLSGKSLNLEVLYDLNKAVLRPESVNLLCGLAEQLKNNKQMRFEIGVHTDSRASASYCTKISQARAQAVVQCLINFGVPPAQLISKGFGETRPVRLSDGTVLTDKFIYAHPEKSEQERLHALNRRTEIRCVGLIQ